MTQTPKNGERMEVRVVRPVRAHDGPWLQAGETCRVRADAYWRKALKDGDVELIVPPQASSPKPHASLKAVKADTPTTAKE